MPILVYHNPRCSKSRKTLEIINAAGADATIVRYLDEPPDGAAVLKLAASLGLPVRGLLRRGEAAFTEADDVPDLDDDTALADWIAAHPITLQRPIVVHTDSRRAVIGRPPENVRQLLD